MKKFLFLLLAVMMLIAGVNYFSYASSGALFSISPDDSLSITTFTYDDIASPISGLTAGTRLIGWTVSSATASTGAIFDSATLAGCTASALIGEVYIGAASTETTWYPFPRTLVNGLTVGGTTSTAQTQYYTFYYL